jgi:hypothetical protein
VRALHLALICALIGFFAMSASVSEEQSGRLLHSGSVMPGWEVSYNGVLTLCTLERQMKGERYRLFLTFWRNLSPRHDGRRIPLIMIAEVVGLPAVSPIRVTSGETTVELLRPQTLPDKFSFGSESPAVEALLRAHMLGSPITVSFQLKDGSPHTLEVDATWIEVSGPMFEACASSSPNNKLQRSRGAASGRADG